MPPPFTPLNKCCPQFTMGWGLQDLAILSWEAKASCEFLWRTTSHLGVRTNQSASINHSSVYHLSITSSITSTPFFITPIFSTVQGGPVHARFNPTSPDRREAQTEHIYQQSPYEGSGNLNIHCWHCAELAGGQSGPAPLGTRNILCFWLKR